MQAALPLGMNITTATVLATLQPSAGDPTLTDTQLTIPASRQSQEAGPTGPVATDIPADPPAEAGSLTETTTITSEEASAPATAPTQDHNQ